MNDVTAILNSDYGLSWNRSEIWEFKKKRSVSLKESRLPEGLEHLIQFVKISV